MKNDAEGSAGYTSNGKTNVPGFDHAGRILNIMVNLFPSAEANLKMSVS